MPDSPGNYDALHYMTDTDSDRDKSSSSPENKPILDSNTKPGNKFSSSPENKLKPIKALDKSKLLTHRRKRQMSSIDRIELQKYTLALKNIDKEIIDNKDLSIDKLIELLHDRAELLGKILKITDGRGRSKYKGKKKKKDKKKKKKDKKKTKKRTTK